VRYPKFQKIDIRVDYPCPCCNKKGKLLHITLTEAFGCDRCRRMFVLKENSTVIEELSYIYPYKPTWRWLGNRWLQIKPNWTGNYLAQIFRLVLIVLAIGLPIALLLTTHQSFLFWGTIFSILVIIPLLIFWLAYRR
jgi:hypothetical protein